MKRAGIVVVLLVFFLMGFVNADDPVNATSQTQFIHTETSVVVSGDLSNEATIVWQQSSESLDDDVSLSESERLATMSYSESTRANNGYVEYNKVADLDTGNQVINQNNFKSTRQLDFVSFNNTYGSIISDESLVLDSASSGSSISGRTMCPFMSSDDGSIPAYCNIIEMGSSFTGTAVSMTTIANERHIAKTSDVPVAMDYSISLAGKGAASAYYRMHIQSARGDSLNKSMDIVGNEKTTASGIIQKFEKTMNYGSGARLY